MRMRVPRIFAAVLSVVAALCVLAAIGGAWRNGTEPVRELIDTLLVPAPANLGYAAFLGTLAAATARRKRVAFAVLVGYFAVAMAGNIVAGGLLLFVDDRDLVDDGGEPLFTDAERIGVAAGVVVAVIALTTLILARKQFYARVRHGSVRRAAAVFVVLAAIGIGLGYGLVTAFPGTLTGFTEELGYAAEKVLGGAVSFDVTRDGSAPGWVNLLLGLFGALALFAALFALLRSQQREAELNPDEEARIRELLDRWGDRDSLGYFATRRDKAVVFSASGKAAVTYRVVNGVSLASADPIGDPEAWGPAIQAWLTQARTYAWTPAVMGASEEGATAYARHGLRILHLGDESILFTGEFTLDGRDMRPVRQAANRVARAGYTARVRRQEAIPPDQMRAAADLAIAWRDTEAERGFSMALGRLGDPADGRCVLVEAVDNAGNCRALLSFSPWGRHGLSLDLMRRDREAENGVMEFMVAALMGQGPELGVERVSLNFAAFRSAFSEGARIGAGPVLRLWRRTLLFFSRWWQLESLYRSNAKYQPHWVPRYLGFGERRDLAKVGFASMTAEGFLVLPGAPARHLLVGPGSYVEQAPPVATVAVPPALPEQTQLRLKKRSAMIESGINPYPVGYAPDASCAEVAADHSGLPADTRTGRKVAVAGRVVRMRNHGRLCFATVRDWSGDLQVMLESGCASWKSTVDAGDQVWVRGEVITTRAGQVTVDVADWAITGKCLHPWPDKRYVPADLKALRERGATVHSLRDSLVRRGFVEVESPDPRYLQRLLVGGLERVFGTDSTTLAVYQAYADSERMLDLARELIREAARAVGSTVELSQRLTDELVTAETVRTDPLAQREDLTEPDEDYLTALEFAMPPAGGLSLGVDELVRLLFPPVPADG